MATNFGNWCPKVTNFGSQNFGYQIWFCTWLLMGASSVMQHNSVYCLYFRHKHSTVQTSVCLRKWRQVSTEFNHVEFSRPALTSASIPDNQKSDPRSSRADALFCNGDAWTYTLTCLYFYAWRNLCWNRYAKARAFASVASAKSINPA